MEWIKRKYKENINGIMFTLLFHILFFIILNISHYKIKDVYFENEIIIDFPEEVLVSKTEDENKNNESAKEIATKYSNIASNRAITKETKEFSNDFEEEIKKANQLIKDVNKQLSKEIPTIANLKMPVESTLGMNPDSILKKLYNGDSNVEYFLEKRYHISLPIPVYLSQKGGTVKVNIVVDYKGNVVNAEPIIEPNISDQILSYAKTAALKTRFNALTSPSQPQSGYIKYRFIAQ